jgi:hypothetical protein
VVIDQWSLVSGKQLKNRIQATRHAPISSSFLTTDQ